MQRHVPLLNIRLFILSQDGSSLIRCPSIPLNRSFHFILTWSQGSKTHYSSLLPDFNKHPWLSLFKYTKKVKPLLHLQVPAQLRYCTLCAQRQSGWDIRQPARPSSNNISLQCNTSPFIFLFSFYFLFSTSLPSWLHMQFCYSLCSCYWMLEYLIYSNPSEKAVSPYLRNH